MSFQLFERASQLHCTRCPPNYEADFVRSWPVVSHTFAWIWQAMLLSSASWGVSRRERARLVSAMSPALTCPRSGTNAGTDQDLLHSVVPLILLTTRPSSLLSPFKRNRLDLILLLSLFAWWSLQVSKCDCLYCAPYPEFESSREFSGQGSFSAPHDNAYWHWVGAEVLIWTFFEAPIHRLA